MYAIVNACGKQYKVCEGDLVRFEKLDAEAGSEVSFEVAAISTDEGLKVGNEVSSASVKGTVLKQDKAKKVIVYKYKPKTGYHKKQGHRQPFTLVKIEKISV